MSRYDLVVLGDCNPDVLVLGSDVDPVFGQQEKLVDGISLVIGGSAAITAVAAARLGLRVALAAAVGADPAGEFMRDQLAAEGVDVRFVAVREDAPTGMTVALSRGGDRAILTALGAVASLTAADVPEALLAGARHVHASSWFLLQDRLGPGLGALFSAARSAGVMTSLDTNWDPSGRWASPDLSAVIAQAGLLLPNEAEAIRLAGADDLDAAVSALVAAGPRVVVKLGERGALCADGRSMPGQPAAGDAGRHHRRGRLLQRRPDRRAAGRAGPAPGGRAGLRRRRAVHRPPPAARPARPPGRRGGTGRGRQPHQLQSARAGMTAWRRRRRRPGSSVTRS